MTHPVLNILNAGAAAVCFFAVFLLFSRSEGIRARKVLGGTLLAWGMVYLISFIRMGEIERMGERGFIPLFGVVFGVLGGCSLMFYVLEVLRSGWLNWKRVLWILSPYFLAIAILIFALTVGNMKVRHLKDPADFLIHIHEFNVWYRLVFLMLTIGYVCAMYTLFIRYAPRYQKWTEDNYSSTELMDISWLRYLLLGITGLCLIYFFAMGNETILPLYLHFPAVILFFPYLTSKGLFLQNPYPAHFFQKSLLEEKIDIPEELPVDEEESDSTGTDYDKSLTRKLEEYRIHFEGWIEKEKPYLRSDFKLADVKARLPMNRTYLARFFSEMYGCTFSTLVRRYRVNEAKHILQKHPSMVSKELYFLCGFTSETIFHRAFTEITGCTPKQFRGGVINDE